MALKFKMKDIGHEMFRGANITLNWLEYMSDGDVLYPGPKVRTLFSEEAMTPRYETVFRNDSFHFIRSVETNKIQVICLTTFKPNNYKQKTMQQLLDEAQSGVSSVDSIPFDKIYGVSDIQVSDKGIAFIAETKMYASEHSLIALEYSYNDDNFKRLLIHAFLVKDIFIPVKARVRIKWGERSFTSGVDVQFLLNGNTHITVRCFGTLTSDLGSAYVRRDKGRMVLLLMSALGNVNLVDTSLWAVQKLFTNNCAIHTVIKGGKEIVLTRENFDSICPPVSVDFEVVKTIIKRHEIE